MREQTELEARLAGLNAFMTALPGVDGYSLTLTRNRGEEVPRAEVTYALSPLDEVVTIEIKP